MELGNFSVSLNVKDLAASKKFYESLGFSMIHGDQSQGWVIMKNGETNIGLFQGMFEQNILTFNPGWNSKGENTDSYTDIREIQSKLKESGIKIEEEIEESKGPASFTVIDPDGNPVLIDQHR